jgi:hypothetical protein
MEPEAYQRLQAAAATMEPVSEKHFYKIWRQDPDLRRIRCRRYLRFSKCDLCVKLRANVPHSLSGGLSHRQIDKSKRRKAFSKHIKDIKAERGAYMNRKRHAALYPDETMSIIIDGADQQNMGVPWYVEKSNMMKNTHKIGFNVYGVLVHGRKPYVYMVQDNVKLGKSSIDNTFFFLPHNSSHT